MFVFKNKSEGTLILKLNKIVMTSLERDWSAFLILAAPLAPEGGSKLEIQNF